MSPDRAMHYFMNGDGEARTGTRFDCAVDFYDSTRGLPAEEFQHSVTLLKSALTSSPVLEVGAGTGRIALPLARAGYEVLGVDLSQPMLSEFRHKARSGGIPMRLAVGDGTRLPFGDGQFGSCILSLVLHVSPVWPQMLSEAIRVLHRDGVLVVDLGGQQAHVRLIHEKLAEMLDLPRMRTGVELGREDLVDDYMRDRGWRADLLPPVVGTRRVSPQEALDDLRNNRWSWTWRVPQDRLNAAADRMTTWLRGAFDDVASPRAARWLTQWRVYRPDSTRSGLVDGSLNQLRYAFVHGDGLPVVLLHPMGVDHRFWSPLLNAMRTRPPCLLVDLPGHGASASRPDWNLSLSEELGELHTRLGLDRVRVVGASLGAQVAARLAAERPDAVAELMVVGSNLLPPTTQETAGFVGMADQVEAVTEEEAWDTYAALFIASGTSETLRLDLRQMFRTVGAVGLADALRSHAHRGAVVIPPSVPVTSVTAADDPLAGAQRAWEADRGSLHRQVMVDGGHFHAFERPDQLATLLDQAASG
jgi:pimeloyl-ACP methyl ester carboxylesterase/protein-L-isoaspartate O-methyltransferase